MKGYSVLFIYSLGGTELCPKPLRKDSLLEENGEEFWWTVAWPNSTRWSKINLQLIKFFQRIPLCLNKDEHTDKADINPIIIVVHPVSAKG